MSGFFKEIINENLQSIDTSRSTHPSTSTENVTRYRKLKSFDCGECLVGEQVTLPLIVKNVGDEGRFFIMSEIDWCSMHIEVKVIIIVLKYKPLLTIIIHVKYILLFHFRMLLMIIC